MKPLIIGEAPSKNEHPPSPIAGRIGKRLARCADMPFERFLEEFDRVNLLTVRQDAAEKGFTFDLGAARLVAREMRWTVPQFSPSWTEDRFVLLLGQRVASAFDVRMPYLEEFKLHGARTFILPHPSGVNRWWNDPLNERRMHDFMGWLKTEAGL